MWPARCRAIDGFDCAAASLPARGVGGDFYDVFRRSSSRRWALLLGDASGKGMAAGSWPRRYRRACNTAARLARLEAGGTDGGRRS